MVANPAVRHDSRVKLAHYILPNVINTTFVMPFIHLRTTALGALCRRKHIDVVILPNKMQAVNGMSARGGRYISTTY